MAREHVLDGEQMQVRKVHTLARWCLSENDGIPWGVIWLWLLCGLSLFLSLKRDALSQTVVDYGRHGSRNAKAERT